MAPEPSPSTRPNTSTHGHPNRTLLVLRFAGGRDSFGAAASRVWATAAIVPTGTAFFATTAGLPDAGVGMIATDVGVSVSAGTATDVGVLPTRVGILTATPVIVL